MTKQTKMSLWKFTLQIWALLITFLSIDATVGDTKWAAAASSMNPFLRKRKTPASSTQQQHLSSSSLSTTRPHSNILDKKINHPQRIPRAGGATAATATAAAATTVFKPLSSYLRIALAGGVAGATGTAALYPMDSAKT